MRISTGNPIVDAMASINISGNIIPHRWYLTITRENGKPYLLAIVILADIVYWYRPREIRDEGSGRLIGMAKRFKSDMLQRSYLQLSDHFGVSKKQAKEAIDHLEKIGVIRKHLRTVVINGQRLNNVMYIELIVDELAQVTYGDTTPPTKNSTTPLLKKEPRPTHNRPTNTENNTRNKQKIQKWKEEGANENKESNDMLSPPERAEQIRKMKRTVLGE